MTAREPFCRWSGWPLLGHFLLYSAAVSLWFALVYGGADYLTARRALRVRIHLDCERHIPFVPATVLLYVSIYPLFALAPFVLRRREELRALAATLAAVILCGGVGFLLLPAESAFTQPGHAGRWQELYALARQLARRYNMVPSLHVALGVACVAIYVPRASRAVAALLWTWAAGIAISTLLTHQHHLLDVATGWLLGWAGGWVFRRCQPPRLASRRG